MAVIQNNSDDQLDPLQRRGTGFTNLKKYIDANKQQSAQLGQQVSGTINSATDQAKQQVTQIGEQFGQRIETGAQRFDPTTFNQTSDADLQTIQSAQYKGPNASEIATTINPLIQSATQKAQLAETDSGRTQLLRDMQPSQRQSAGVLGLNQYLLSRTPESRAALDLAVQRAKNELPSFVQDEIAKRQSAADQARKMMMDQASAARGEIGLRQQRQEEMAKQEQMRKQAEVIKAQQEAAAKAALQKQTWLEQQSNAAPVATPMPQVTIPARIEPEVAPQVTTPVTPEVTTPAQVTPEVTTPVETPTPAATYVPKPDPVYKPPNPLTEQEALALMGGKQNTSNKQVGDPRNPDTQTDPKTWDSQYSAYWSDAQKYQYMKATGVQFALSPNVSNELARRAQQANDTYLQERQATIDENTRNGTQFAAQQAAQALAARMAAQVTAPVTPPPTPSTPAVVPSTVTPPAAVPTMTNQQVFEAAKQKYGSASPDQILTDASNWDRITSERGMKLTPQEVLDRAIAYTARDQLKLYQANQNRQQTAARMAASNQPTQASVWDRILGSVGTQIGTNIGTQIGTILSDENMKDHVSKLTTFDVDKILGKYENSKELG